MTGTEWVVHQLVKVTDGDTVRVVRRRDIELDGHRYTLSDAAPDGIPIRLVWVDTPERGKPGYNQARDDLKAWIDDRIGPWVDDGEERWLRVVCYESAGWDRLLGDLIDTDGNSASQWLMIKKGWLPYAA